MSGSSSSRASTLRHLTDGIYAFPGDMERAEPWVGAVVTPEGTVLIDSGNGPLQARALQAALVAIEAPPVTHILLTHHHWDHVFGSAYFPDARIVAHTLTQRHLRIMAEEPWSASYVESKAESFPRGRIVAEFMKRAVPDWRTFQVLPATETFEERYELSLGGYHFLMEHVGGQHEPDQCIVRVQPGNVLFLGDAAYGRGARSDWDRAALAEMLSGLLARGADWFVEGHRLPVQADRFAGRIGRLRNEGK